MLKMNLSSRTKKLGALSLTLLGASVLSIINDKEKSIRIRNKVITSQDFYICELEQFIMDNVTGYEFPEMVGIPK